MSDTPETDDQPIIYALNELQYQILCVDLEFARKLERERDEARNRMADALQELDLRTLDFERMRAERDEARHEIEGWRNKWECAVTMAAVAEDEIIKKLEEILNKQ